MPTPEIEVSPVGPSPEFTPPAPAPVAAPPLNTDSVGAVSPTGKPVIPPSAVPYLTVVVGTAAVMHEAVPADTQAGSIIHLVTAIVLALGAVLGLASPGLRKSAQ